VTNNLVTLKIDPMIIIIKPFIMKPAIITTLLVILILVPECGKRAGSPDPWVPSPETVERLSAANPSVNYYEEKVPEYTLPDLLRGESGKKVRSAADWTEFRRQEILELFRENVFGRVPQTSFQQIFRITNEDKNAMNGAATLKQIDVIIQSDGDSLIIHLTLFVPNTVPKPVPAFLLIDNRGPANTDPTRVLKSQFWPAEEVISRGYGIAVFYNADLDPDNDDGFKNGIHGLLDKGVRKPDSWGTIAAWAWGASRCMDYFEEDMDIDAEKIAVVGHSRGGKTALWAGAEDQRFAMVVSNESGCGGAALARRRFGETVELINKSFPHWFCENYKKYNGNEDYMPFDMHMLLALIAPRALYVASAADDLWADPKGSYLSLRYTSQVYKLFGKGTRLKETMPPLNEQVVEGNLAYHVREGEHNLLLKDWNFFLDFADKVLR
jgi:pimeloyl-ACP methyl ester carboxylesterase